MNPVRFWFGIFAVLAIVVVAPAWAYWAGPGLRGTPLLTDWLVAALLPLTVLITLASWIQPGGT